MTEEMTPEAVETEAVRPETAPKKPARKETSYCPKCAARYTYDVAECVTCSVPLQPAPPSAGSYFKPKVDIPAILFAVVFFAFYSRLPGEARSFGTIAIIVGFGALAVVHFLDYQERLGRR